MDAIDREWLMAGGGGGDTVSSDWWERGGDGVELLLSGDEPPLNDGEPRPPAVLLRKGDEVLTEEAAMERMVDCDEWGDESVLLVSDDSRLTEAESATSTDCGEPANMKEGRKRGSGTKRRVERGYRCREAIDDSDGGEYSIV